MQPDPEVLLRLAASLHNRGRNAEALAVIDKLIELNPHHARSWNLRGNLLLVLGRIAEALDSYDRAIALNYDYPEARHNRGVALMQTGRHDEAEREFARAVAIRPRDGASLESLGICLSVRGKHNEAVETLDRALAAGALGAATYRSRAESLLQLKRPAEALASYDRAVEISSDAEYRSGRGMLLLSMQRNAEALSDFDRVLSRFSGDATGWLGRGIALIRLGLPNDAIAALDHSLRLRPDDSYALYNRANAFALLHRFEEAAADCENLLRISPEYPYGLGLLLHARLYACDWRDYDILCASAAEAVRKGCRAIHPFLNLTISDSPKMNLRAAEIFANDLYPPASPPCWRGERYGHEKIRIAYLSADFYRHATAFLMADVFEQHDRSRFETIAVSYGPNDHSKMRNRLEKAFDHFFEVGALSDRAIAEKLREMEVDIAIDLKGYTGDGRPGIMVERPAPVQVHYLGYPGSLGTSAIDYLIADETVIPPDEIDCYSEHFVHLPGCYQCNDSKRPDATDLPARAEAGLPPEHFVFCCFNSSFKISPEIFGAWMRLLRDVPQSVLWLLESNLLAATNLQREAAARGIGQERLIFAPQLPLERHLARIQLADLALDTFPYGAHTTASDAVWAGVPLVTISGASFAARVATSILNAAGVPELITTSIGEYENRAAALARDTQALAALRGRLRTARASPLFDTVLFTRRLESAYTTMYRRYERGIPPNDRKPRAYARGFLNST